MFNQYVVPLKLNMSTIFQSKKIKFVENQNTYTHTDNSWTTRGLQAPSLTELKIHVILQLALHTGGSTTWGSTNCPFCSTAARIYQKISMYKWISTVQPMLFKGQLYLQDFILYPLCCFKPVSYFSSSSNYMPSVVNAFSLQLPFCVSCIFQ